MKVLVTGASGFIGTPLCQRLAQLGHEVVAMYRDVSRLPGLLHERITPFRGDITSLADIETAMQNCDACLHLAALAKPWARNPDFFNSVNVTGTYQVFLTAQQAKLKRVLFVSTASIFGPANANHPASENSSTCGLLDTAYERTKQACEEIVQEFQSTGIDIVTVYPSRVFGPGPPSQSNALTHIFQRFACGKWRVVPGSGESVGNYIFIDDVVEGVCAALFNGQRNDRYLLGGENLSFNQIVNHLREATGNRQTMIHVPGTVLFIFAQLELVKSTLTGRPPTITPAFVKKYLKDWYLDCSKSKAELGVVETPFATGLEKTLAWSKLIE